MARSREQIIRVAEKFVAKGRLEAAIKEYRKVLANNPNDANTLNRVGDLYARIERFDEAVKLFTQIAEQYTRDGFFVKAIAIYKKIIKLDPMTLPVYERLAELYAKQGLMTEARTQYQVLADYYEKHQNAASAISIYQRMSELEPENPSFHLKLAELYKSQSLTEKAMRSYRQLADLFVVNGSIDEAVQVYAEALETDSSDLAFVRNAVSGLKDAGHVEAARKVLERATTHNAEAEAIAREVGLVDGEEAPAEEVVPQPDFEENDDTFDAPPVDQDSSFEQLPGFASADAETEESGVFVLDLDSDDVPDSLVIPPADMMDSAAPAATATTADQGSAEQDDGGNGEEQDVFELVIDDLEDEAPSATEIDFDFEEIELEQVSLEPADEPFSDPLLEAQPVAADEPEIALELEAIPLDEVELAEGSEHGDIAFEDLAGDATIAISATDLSDATDFGDATVFASPEPADKEAAADSEAAAIELDLEATDPEETEIEVDWTDDANLELPALAATEVEEAPEIELEIELTEPELPEPEEMEAAAPELPEPAPTESPEPEPAAPEAVAPEPAPEPEAPAPVAAEELAPEEPAASAPPPHRVEDLLAEAEVFAKYGLREKAEDRLQELLAAQPQHLPGLQLLTRIYLEEGRHAAVIERANEVSRLAVESDQTEFWFDLRDALTTAGYGFNGPWVVVGEPGTKPTSEDRISLLLDELSGDRELMQSDEESAAAPAATEIELDAGLSAAVESLMEEPSPAPTPAAPTPATPTPPPSTPPTAAPEPEIAATQEEDEAYLQEAATEVTTTAEDGRKLISLADELDLDNLDDGLEGITIPSGPAIAPLDDEPAPVAASDALDETGMSWLDEVDEAEDEDAADGDALFDEEDDFFDLAAELERELIEDDARAEIQEHPQEQSLEEIVEGFKKGVAENLSPEDYDTHFNLGIAYREMGLLDEAIGEFQLASKDERYLVECSSMLGLCFSEKGLPELAIKWYRKGLESSRIGERETLGMLYDMGNAYVSGGDEEAAHKTFVEVYSLDNNYRDVVARLEELGGVPD